MKQVVPCQYKPFNHQIGNLPLIVYPVKNTGNLHELATDKDAIRRYLDELYQRQDETIGRGVFHIVFVWAWHGMLMADVWIQQLNTMAADVNGEIGIDRCVNFKEYELYPSIGIATDNEAVIVGREQELRWRFDSLDKYLDRTESMPDFVAGFAPTDDF